MAHKKIIIAPDKGGQIDFLNNDNSLLFKSNIGSIPKNHQYWIPQENGQGITFNVDDLSEKMLYAYNNYKKLNESLDFKIDKKFTWSSIAEEVLCLA